MAGNRADFALNSPEGQRTFGGHELTCVCPDCSEVSRMREQRISLDAPTGSLAERSVSLGELVDNATLTNHLRFSIGEDWGDD